MSDFNLTVSFSLPVCKLNALELDVIVKHKLEIIYKKIKKNNIL